MCPSESAKMQLLQEELSHLRSEITSLTAENVRLLQCQGTLEVELTRLRQVEQELLSALELAFLDKSDLEIMLDLAVSHGDAVEVQLYTNAEQAWHMAGIDELTQLPNRRRLLEFLDRMWRQMMRENCPLSVLMCDVDHFKRFNDFYGHHEGDECLRKVAQAIAEAVRRPTDLAARYGGEEFVVVLPDTTIEGAQLVANAIREEVSALNIVHQYSDISHHITISIGTATSFPKKGEIPTCLIQAADQALFKAKRNGRDRVEIYQIS